jgi:hypothetical protein
MPSVPDFIQVGSSARRKDEGPGHGTLRFCFRLRAMCVSKSNGVEAPLSSPSMSARLFLLPDSHRQRSAPRHPVRESSIWMEMSLCIFWHAPRRIQDAERFAVRFE